MSKPTKGRVKIARSPEGILEQTAKVYTKHQGDGEASVLKGVEDYDWDVSGPKITIAQKHHDDAVHYKGLMEEAYRERDIYIPELKEINQATAAYLKSKNRKNPKRLIDYGYEVDDTPPAKSKGGTPPAKS